MGEAIVITGGKGGVGKSTIAANLGAALAILGHRTLLVDTDIGLRNLDILLGMDDRIVYDIADVCDGSCDLKKCAIRDKRYDNLYLIPASQAKDKDAITALQMKAFIKKAKAEYEYIIIDSPAGIEHGFKVAAAAADRAIVAVQPFKTSVKDADRVIGLLENYGIENIEMAINRIRQKMVDEGSMLSIEEISDILSIDLIGVIPDDEKVIAAENTGLLCVADEKSKAGTAYRNIAKRLLGENVELMELSDKRGMLARIMDAIRGK